MTGNSPSPTPSPDMLNTPDEAMIPTGPTSPHPGAAPGSSTSSGDEFYALLAETTPDPFLQGGSGEGAAPDVPPEPETPAIPQEPLPAPEVADEPADGSVAVAFIASLSSTDNEIDIPVVFTPPPDAISGPAATPADEGPHAAEPEPHDQAAPVAWRSLILASYASAVTLALVWILGTGRGLRPTVVPEEPAGEARIPDRGAPGRNLIARPSPPLPTGNLVPLGSKCQLDSLEALPSGVAFGSARLERLEGTTDQVREIADVLILRLRVKNRSLSRAFAPLEAAFVRDSGLADDGTFIETADRRRIPMYHLAVESEWSFPDQPFTALAPGKQVDTILVSQPVRLADLAGPFTWHVKLRTDAYRTDVLGIRFQASDIKR